VNEFFLNTVRAAYLVSRRLVGQGLDAFYNIRTEGDLPFRWRAACADGVRYEPTSWFLARKIIERLQPSSEDIIYDIGCGKGRMLALFAQLPVQLVVGIELDPDLARIAESNARKVRFRRAPITVLNANAVDVDYDQGTVFYMFNPFGYETTRLVFERIGQSLRRRPRRIKLALYSPQSPDMLQRIEWLDWILSETKPVLVRARRVLFAVSR